MMRRRMVLAMEVTSLIDDWFQLQTVRTPLIVCANGVCLSGEVEGPDGGGEGGGAAPHAAIRGDDEKALGPHVLSLDSRSYLRVPRGVSCKGKLNAYTIIMGTIISRLAASVQVHQRFVSIRQTYSCLGYRTTGKPCTARTWKTPRQPTCTSTATAIWAPWVLPATRRQR